MTTTIVYLNETSEIVEGTPDYPISRQEGDCAITDFGDHAEVSEPGEFYTQLNPAFPRIDGNTRGFPQVGIKEISFVKSERLE